jgi:transcriptional regulator with XRE-family HTH domain
VKNFFPDVLRAIMQEEGLETQARLANYLGITQPSVNALLNGGKPSYELLQRMVADLGYNPFALILGHGPLRIKQEGELQKIPTDIIRLALKLVRYPALVHDILKYVEMSEEYERVKEELKTKLHNPKKK